MSLAGYKIFIDPGHGGTQPGAVYGGVEEEDIVLNIGLKLRTKLQGMGATVQMSRTGDTTVSLADRVTMSNNFGASIFISLHNNALGTGAASGVETWKHDKASSYTNSLATYVNNQLASKLSATNRGVKSAPSQRGENIYVIDPTYNKAWAILPEILFLDNTTDRSKLTNDTYRQYAADAIAAGVQSFVNTLPPMA